MVEGVDIMAITAAEVAQAWAEQALRAQSAEQRVAKLTEENDELRKENTSLIQQIDSLKPPA